MNSDFKKLSSPYKYWLYIFALFPVLIMIFLVFLDTEGISMVNARFTIENFSSIVQKSTLKAYYNSFKFASLSTFICIILGYLVAYRIFRSKFSNKFLILAILILPMWSNTLLRTEALGNIMEPNNIIQELFSRIGINISINLRGTEFAVILGLVITYLPFMILPVYSSLEKIDYSLEEAANDLGVNDFIKFWKVVFPLSMKGVITGSIMVFLPTMSGFVIPQVLGNGKILLIGNIIEQNFKNMSYNVGSLLAIIIIVVIFSLLIVISKIDKEGESLL